LTAEGEEDLKGLRGLHISGVTDEEEVKNCKPSLRDERGSGG